MWCNPPHLRAFFIMQLEGAGQRSSSAQGRDAGHSTFSHAFVARFLEKWMAAGWDKGFLDKVCAHMTVQVSFVGLARVHLLSYLPSSEASDKKHRSKSRGFVHRERLWPQQAFA